MARECRTARRPGAFGLLLLRRRLALQYAERASFRLESSASGTRSIVEIPIEENRSWTGRFSAGDNLVPLERVRVKGHDVHFELAGAGVFDGSVAGDSMAGSVSGALGGSFFLHRQDTPPWNIEFMMGP